MKKKVYLIMLFTLSHLLSYNCYAQDFGKWREINSLNKKRFNHGIVELKNGNLLVCGGEFAPDGGGEAVKDSTCEIYNFKTNQWNFVSPTNIPRTMTDLIDLPDSNILAIGGYRERSCEVYNVELDKWVLTDSIPTYRYFGHKVIKLLDGRILVLGGFTIDPLTHNMIYLNNVDIYDPTISRWRSVSSMNKGRWGFSATLLTDGRILVAGGGDENNKMADCEIYDPLLDKWEITTPMNEPRYFHASVLLKDGSVFVSGSTQPWVKTCEVYNPTNRTWTYVENMIDVRSEHTIYYLQSVDRLMILGGAQFQGSLEDTWELYNPNDFYPIISSPFPITQNLHNNFCQLENDKIIVVAGEEYYLLNDILYREPTNRCWIYDVVTSVNVEKQLVQDFYLKQNYPNPFNPTTQISYQIPKTGFVNLVVYNLLGQQVAILVNQVQSTGKYSVKFDAGNLPSGVYIYKLHAGEFSTTEKMILGK